MKNRVLVYSENHHRGGGNRYMLDLLDVVSEIFDESVLVINSGGIFPEEIAKLNKGVNLVEIWTGTKVPLQMYLNKWIQEIWILRKLWGFLLLCFEPFVDLYNTLLFIILILRIRPKRILVCNGGYPGATSCLVFVVISRMLRIPPDISIVSMPTQRRRYLNRFEALIDYAVWSCSNRVIVNSHAINQALIEVRGLPSGRSEVVFNGIIDILKFPNTKNDVKNLSDKIVIGFVSRLEESKGVFVLLDAFAKSLTTCHNLELRYYGDGGAREELMKRITQLNLEQKVFLLGHYFGEIEEVMSDIDIYVSPSFWEGLPYGLLEAMRSGLAIIATDVGGTGEAIDNLVSGIIVPPRSVEAIREAVVRVVNEPNLRNTLGINARKAFLANFELSRTRKSALDIFLKKI